VGFVNVVGDGGDHAFLIDTKTRGSFQRRQVGTRVVAFAAQHAKAAGCEWCTSTSMLISARSTSMRAGFSRRTRG